MVLFMAMVGTELLAFKSLEITLSQSCSMILFVTSRKINQLTQHWPLWFKNSGKKIRAIFLQWQILLPYSVPGGGNSVVHSGDISMSAWAAS